MFELEDETVLFLYCWTFNEMQIPATRDRYRRRVTAHAGTNGARRGLPPPFQRSAI
jgi:hypothetical protein